MGLSINQIANLLFKKVATGKSTTDVTREFFEEPFNKRPFVDLSQIWAQSDSIPNVASPIVNIVEQVSGLQLNHVPGTEAAFTHPTLKNVIPFNYGDGVSYNYSIKQNNNTTPIPFGTNNWYLDTETGTLTFFDGLPAGVTTASGPYIDCYKYIGQTADETGLGGGGTGTGTMVNVQATEWQDSVIDFTEIIPDASTSSVEFGDRYIFNGTAGDNVYIYNFENDEFELGTVENADIIEYSMSTSGTSGITEGWKVFSPTNGTFTSIDDLGNLIYYFTLSQGWAQYESEKTYPVGVELTAQDTYILRNGTSGIFPHIGSNTRIPFDATVNTDVDVFINGVKLQDDTFEFVSLTQQTPISSGTGVGFIDFNTLISTSIGDLITISDGVDTFWRVVNEISGNRVFYSGPDVTGAISAILYDIEETRTTPLTDDYLLIKTNISYDVEGTSISEPDSLTVNYVRPNLS